MSETTGARGARSSRSADAPAIEPSGKVASTSSADLEGEPNPKKLVVFCDGTWNDLRMPHLTNVARLAKCVQPTGVMELHGGNTVAVPQVVYYDEGVGVGEGVSLVADRLVRFLGGTLGRGLDAKIEKAYRFIVLNYNPGDEIYIFGFSRGAYTARSLCGLIRKCGVLRRTNFQVISQAIALYRDASQPSHSAAQEFRRQYAHPMISGSEDYTDQDRALIAAFRATVGANPEISVVPPEIRRRGFHIRYLGVWDTVGSLGVPTRFKLLRALTGARYRFHDENASSLIESLRHAVAVDEIRSTFDVTPVANIHELNIQSSTSGGDQVRDPAAARFVTYAERAYQQRWFPGDHGAVGGGNPEPGLSSSGLLWIAEGAARAGLSLDYSVGSELAEAERLKQPCANWRINKDGSPRPAGARDVLGEVGGYKRRSGPEILDEVHETARERWRRDETYRPANLARFLGLPTMTPDPAEPPCGATAATPSPKDSK